MKTPGFSFGKIHSTCSLFCCDKFTRCCVHQPAKVCILQSHLRTRRSVGFQISSHLAFKFPRSYEYPRTLGCNRTFGDEELVGTCEDKFIAVDFDFATILSSPFGSCILFAIVLRQLIKLEFLAQQVQLKWLMLNKWRRLFHSSRVKLPSVKMSASLCLVSMYRIWILESRLILQNNQDQLCEFLTHVSLLDFGLCDHYGFIVLKDTNIALGPECVPLDGTWSMLDRSRLVCLVGICFLMFGCMFADRFHRGSLTSLGFVGLVWWRWNTSITKTQRSRAGIPSMRKHLHRERLLQLQ